MMKISALKIANSETLPFYLFMQKCWNCKSWSFSNTWSVEIYIFFSPKENFYTVYLLLTKTYLLTCRRLVDRLFLKLGTTWWWVSLCPGSEFKGRGQQQQGAQWAACPCVLSCSCWKSPEALHKVCSSPFPLPAPCHLKCSLLLQNKVWSGTFSRFSKCILEPNRLYMEMFPNKGFLFAYKTCKTVVANGS